MLKRVFAWRTYSFVRAFTHFLSNSLKSQQSLVSNEQNKDGVEARARTHIRVRCSADLRARRLATA